MKKYFFVIMVLSSFSFAYAGDQRNFSKAQGNQGYLTGKPRLVEIREAQREEKRCYSSSRENIDIGKSIMKADQWVKEHLW